MKELKPDCLEDLIAGVSLYRPGPMDNIDLFIARREGREKIDYIHPDLENILKPTYGIIIYQEQIMQIAVTLACGVRCSTHAKNNEINSSSGIVLKVLTCSALFR